MEFFGTLFATIEKHINNQNKPPSEYSCSDTIKRYQL